MSEKQEKKVAGKNVAIALGIICIILAVGLVGAIADYTSIISGKDNTISSLNSQITTKNNTISSLNSQIADKDSQIASKDSQISNLQNQVYELNDTLNLAKSTVWVSNEAVNQPAGSYVYWTRSPSYAGYVAVNVQTSTTTNTYVRVIYGPTTYGVSYDNQISVGTGGWATFPIMPTSIEIRVGNTNLLNGASETVSIYYYY
jgi:uncharacterized coiled-coil protein SlyX